MATLSDILNGKADELCFRSQTSRTEREIMSTSESAASLLLDIAKSHVVSSIKSESGETYAVVQNAGQKEIWECSSKDFIDWLSYTLLH